MKLRELAVVFSVRHQVVNMPYHGQLCPTLCSHVGYTQIVWFHDKPILLKCFPELSVE